MTFEEALKELRQGKIVRRDFYAENFVIFMQVPADIPFHKIWDMQSLPIDAKVLLKINNKKIRYRDQFIIYDLEEQVATYHVFDGEDVNATDWEVIDPFCYNYE